MVAIPRELLTTFNKILCYPKNHFSGLSVKTAPINPAVGIDNLSTAIHRNLNKLITLSIILTSIVLLLVTAELAWLQVIGFTR